MELHAIISRGLNVQTGTIRRCRCHEMHVVATSTQGSAQLMDMDASTVTPGDRRVDRHVEDFHDCTSFYL